MAELIAERLEQVQAVSLKSGGHSKNAQLNACVMEAVAYVAGEAWSDAPQCACPVITAFMVSWNDSLPTDEDRDRLLKPLIPLIVGTRSTPAVEMKRSVMAADWLIRTYTPAWLRLAKLESQATMLEALPEITDFAQCPSLMPAGDAARDAAGDAAWAAARDAARDALKPTTAHLQDSAADLVRRMCAVTEIAA